MEAMTVNISLRKDLLKKIDKLAKKECRSRSELLREAARQYVAKEESIKDLLKRGRDFGRKSGLTEQDITDEIAAYRREKRAK